MSVSRVSRRAMLALPLAAGVAGAADVPRSAGPLVFRLPDGKPVDVASYRGKVVCLAFILTTCPHCQNFCQQMQKLKNELGPKGFETLAVATNDMANMLIPEFNKKFAISYPVGFCSRDESITFLQHPIMLTMYMPQIVLMDRKGVIRYQHGGTDKFFDNQEKNLRTEVMALLSESSPAAKPAAAKSAKKS